MNLLDAFLFLLSRSEAGCTVITYNSDRFYVEAYACIGSMDVLLLNVIYGLVVGPDVRKYFYVPGSLP